MSNFFKSITNLFKKKTVSDVFKEDIPLNSHLILKQEGYNASSQKAYGSEVPLLLTDIQKYLLLPILDPVKFPYFECKWITIAQRKRLTNSFVLIVDGIGLVGYLGNQDRFRNLTRGFGSVHLEVLGANTNAVIETLSIVLMIAVLEDKLIKTYGCMDVCLKQLNDPNEMLRPIYPIAKVSNEKLKPSSVMSYNRMSLLLSPSEMLHEKYPVPIPGLMKRKYSNFLFSKHQYTPVTTSSPMFGLDCERCNTEGGSELFRVSIVDENDEAVYNSYVLPEHNIVGNRYTFSEITRSELLQVTTTKKDVQKEIIELLPSDAILIGQSLNYDLIALGMMHPYVINTSCVYNSSGSRLWKSKLRDFTWDYLNRTIQIRGKGHCSIEDSKAAIDLVKLKLSNSPQFGDVILQRQKNNHQQDPTKDKRSKYYKPAIIGEKDVVDKYVQHVNIYADNNDYLKDVDLKPCDDFEKITKETLRLIKDRSFVLSHLNVDTLDEENIKEFDRFVYNVWKACKNETIISIIFTENDNQNGLLFYNIKD